MTVSGDGAGATLRNQIAAAKPADTVEIDAGVNPTLGGKQIAIDKTLTITGQGANQTTVSANGLSRIFEIGSITPGVTVTVEDLTLTGGQAPNGANAELYGAPGGPGGAIISAGGMVDRRHDHNLKPQRDGRQRRVRRGRRRSWWRDLDLGLASGHQLDAL